MPETKDLTLSASAGQESAYGNFDAQEQKEIVQEIEAVISGSMVRDEEALAAFRPRKKGIFFVLAVNSVLATLVTGFFLLAQWYFSGRIDAQRAETSQRFSTEGQLVAKLLENSRRELEAKNQEILSIQQNMEKLNTEKSALAANFESQIAQREESLKAQLARELEEERARLRARGVSDQDIILQLAALEKAKAQEFDSALTRFRQESQAQLEARNRELADLQNRLAQARQEEDRAREALSKAAEDRESALKTQLSDQARSLERLSREREDQAAFTRQLEASLSEVRSKVAQLDFKAAESGLNALDTFLRTAETGTSDGVKSQVRSLQSLAASLRTAVQEAGNKNLLTEDPVYEKFKAAARQALEVTGEARTGALERAAAELPEVRALLSGLEDLRKRAEASSREAQVRQLFNASSALGAEERLRFLLRGLSPESSRVPADQTLTQALEEIQGPLRRSQNALAQELQQVRTLQEELTRRNLTLEEENTDLRARLATAEGEENTALREERDRLKELLAEAERRAAQLEADTGDEQALAGALAEAERLKTDLASAQAALAEAEKGQTEWDEFTAAYRKVTPGILALRTRPEAKGLEEARKNLAQVFLAHNAAKYYFPDFAEVLESLAQAQQALTPAAAEAPPEVVERVVEKVVEKVVEVPADPLPIREKAFGEVLTATRYLAGTSPSAGTDQRTLEQLSREDPQFRKVVESIQELSRKGITESALKTAEFTLYGSLVSLYGTRGVVEPLSSAVPAEGQTVQIRLPGRNGDTLASGKVTSVRGRRVEIEVTQRLEGKAPPASGHVVYLEVR